MRSLWSPEPRLLMKRYSPLEAPKMDHVPINAMGTQVQTKTKQSFDTSLISEKALDVMKVQAEQLQSQINYNQEQRGRLERDVCQSNTQKLYIVLKSLREQLPTIFNQLEAQEREKTTTDACVTKKMAEIKKLIHTIHDDKLKSKFKGSRQVGGNEHQALTKQRLMVQTRNYRASKEQ
ncbi:uncharacterized protein [Eurosta solidaginis]|uniref:uncharacterized protein n=1 Tax=Eurosta solidaginis TaxID=178769 RepID=UPI0035314E01